MKLNIQDGTKSQQSVPTGHPTSKEWNVQ